MKRQAIALFLSLLLVLQAGAQGMREVVSKVNSATVDISAKLDEKDDFRHIGTGWLYQNQHTVVTARHVAEGVEEHVSEGGKTVAKTKPWNELRVKFTDGQNVTVKTVKFFDGKEPVDIAVLILDKDAVKGKTRVPLKLAAEAPQMGDVVFGVGYPFEYGATLFEGKLTGFFKDEDGDFFSMSAIIAPGHSGSAVCNEKGEVIGIAVWIDLRRPNLNFAVSHKAMKSALAVLMID